MMAHFQVDLLHSFPAQRFYSQALLELPCMSHSSKSILGLGAPPQFIHWQKPAVLVPLLDRKNYKQTEV